MKFDKRIRFMAVGVTVGILALSGCATPPPPPPPPPPRLVIPPRPWPPLGAAPNLMTPKVGFDGVRRTVNTGLTPAQTTWNLRSAFNVAALNCLQPQHAGILEGYKKFLTNHAKALTALNGELDKQYKAQYGPSYVRDRETYNTQVYNYFALPPTLPQFCDAVLAMSQQSLTVTSPQLGTFAATSLPQLEAVFQSFFSSYDRYRTDAAAWDARYGAAQPQVSSAAATTQGRAQ